MKELRNELIGALKNSTRKSSSQGPKCLFMSLRMVNSFRVVNHE